jgi:hypothetical protein
MLVTKTPSPKLIVVGQGGSEATSLTLFKKENPDLSGNACGAT